MKKIILKFGTIIPAIAPIAIMMACADDDMENKKAKLAEQEKINSIVEEHLTWINSDRTKLPSQITS